VGRTPSKVNPTSPVVAGGQLLLIDQGGYIHRWDGTKAQELFTLSKPPPDIRPIGVERLLNVAAHPAGSEIYVVVISSSVPRKVPRRQSIRDSSDAWYVLIEYDFSTTGLSGARAITAMEARTDGHTGGGLSVLEDGSILFGAGDNGDSYEDGRDYSQSAASHLGKILRIDPADGSVRVVAVGVRNCQRLVVYGTGEHARLDFMDPGGWVAEELNSIPLSNLLDPGSPANFGWGRNPKDGKAREGTTYIDQIGNSVARIPAAEPGFVEPIAEFGREGAAAVGPSGPVSSVQSFSRITSLFGDLVSGSVFAVTGALRVSRQDVFRVNLVDSRLQPVTLRSLAGGERPDPRFFNFPDGSAGVLIERTGDFYRLTELAPAK
jgi:hypothetical protein